MRNTTQRVIGILVLWAVSGLLLNFEPVQGAETLTVTKDQFEFRDSPQVTEETLIGTLRAGTAVEWTGTVSGDWFEVRGPGNQLGWIHKSGLSAPKAAPTSQQPSTTAPAGTTSSSAAATRAPSASTQQKQVAELEKANAQYKAQLDEKELRLTELTQEIEALEQKLLNTAQEASDTQQLRDMQQAQVAEFEKQLAELKATLEQKDAELLRDKMEFAKLQTQVTTLQNRAYQGPIERYILYGLTGLLGFLLLGGVVWYVRQNASAAKQGFPPSDQRPERIHADISERPGGPERQPESILSATPELPLPAHAYIAEEVEDAEAIEEVEIELSDMLPATDLDSPEPPRSGEDDDAAGIAADQDLAIGEDLEIIAEVEALETVIEGSEIVEVIETVEDSDSIETADIANSDSIETADIIEAIDEYEDAEELIEVEAIDEFDELDVIEEAEVVDHREEVRDYHDATALATDDTDRAELFDQGLSLDHNVSTGFVHEELEELESHLNAFDGEHPENEAETDFDFDSIYESETFAAVHQPVSQSVDIGGETYEMLVEPSTRIIETETDDAWEEEVLSAPKAFEELPDRESEDLPTLMEEIENFSDLLEAREMELEKIHRDPGYREAADDVVPDSDDGQTYDAEIEELEEYEEYEDIDDLDDLEFIEEVDETGFEAAGETVFESVSAEHPDLLEPSPVLIEPEYEPADVPFSASGNSVSPPVDKVATYEIELVHVGNNTRQIVEFLAKVKGLPKPPDELVRKLPVIITREAKEIDAQNFRLLMQKLGATVRVRKH